MSNDRKCLSMRFPDGQTDDGGGDDFSDGGVADSDTPLLLSSFFRSAFDSIMVGVVGDHGRASEGERTERNEEKDREGGERRGFAHPSN